MRKVICLSLPILRIEEDGETYCDSEKYYAHVYFGYSHGEIEDIEIEAIEDSNNRLINDNKLIDLIYECHYDELEDAVLEAIADQDY